MLTNLPAVLCTDVAIMKVCTKQLEAKEGVTVARESKTLATITFQNFFRLYNKLSGMTGTAMTEEEEFREIYNLDVVEVPTNRPPKRIDHSDLVYKTEKANTMLSLRISSNTIKRTACSGWYHFY